METIKKIKSVVTPKTLLHDSNMHGTWYKDPHITCIFKVMSGNYYIAYSRIDNVVALGEINENWDKQTLEINEELIILNGFNNVVTSIKHYVINKKDYLLAGCEDNLLMFSCDDWTLNYKINVQGGFIYNFVVASMLYDNMIIVTSFTENFPLMIYDYKGEFKEKIDMTGIGFYLNTYYNKDNKLFLIIANWSCDLFLFDYDLKTFISKIKLKGNLKNCFLSKEIINEINFVILDWSGILYEIDLYSGKIIKELKGFAKSPALCKLNDDKFMVTKNDKNCYILKLSTWEEEYTFNNMHGANFVINIWNIEFNSVGTNIVSYGFDKCIKYIPLKRIDQ